jgi:Phosphorylase superfamily
VAWDYFGDVSTFLILEIFMTVDRAWIERNLGFDPISTPAPGTTVASKTAAKAGAGPEDFQKEIIDFDSESPAGAAFFAFSKATGLSRFTDIPWPKGLVPQTGPKPSGDGSGPLPSADVLIVTWTVDEGHALSRVLTPGKDSHNDYVPYTHNYDSIAPSMSKASPAVQAKRLGTYWTTTIGKKKVVVFKSDSHLSQDTNKHLPSNGVLPNALVWKQIVAEVQPALVITTGTGGGIGKELEVGDVIVSPVVRFDCQKWLKSTKYHDASYQSSPSQNKYFAQAKTLFKANSAQLPAGNKRPPKIIRVSPSDVSSSVVTTDFFGFDTSSDFYKLKGLGDLSEMGDAILGMVADELGAKAPKWVAVRNVSDPQIKSDGLTITQQANMAATIYKGYGRWSTVCSAIVCWALVAALP